MLIENYPHTNPIMEEQLLSSSNDVIEPLNGKILSNLYL